MLTDQGTRSQWEAALHKWVKKSSDDEEQRCDRTEREIREAISSSPRLATAPLKVYVKGSYANHTNVRRDYDVDIAVEYNGFFYMDTSGAAPDVKLAAQRAWRDYTGPYAGPTGPSEFKRDVEQALVAKFGRTAISRGNLALRVRERRTTLPADVVPCFEYRYVYGLDAQQREPQFRIGTRLYPDRGPHIHNWPQQQYECGVRKNDATGRRYKRMVRALKRLENELVKAGKLIKLPSFFMECLVYNVPNESFGHSEYIDDMRAVLATIFSATRTPRACEKWVEASECKWLFHSSQGWNHRQAHELADQAWDHLGLQ